MAGMLLNVQSHFTQVAELALKYNNSALPCLAGSQCVCEQNVTRRES